MAERATASVVALVAGVFLLAAWVVDAGALWSPVANHSVPWFLSAVGIGLAVVAMTAALLGVAPQRVPPLARWFVTAVVVGGLVLCSLVDGWMLFEGQDVGSLIEVLGFGLVLAVLFHLPLLGQAHAGPAAAESDADLEREFDERTR